MTPVLFTRSLIYWLGFFLSTLLVSTAAIIARPLGADASLHVSRQWSNINLFMLKWICGLDYRVEGAHNVGDRNAVVMCKHQSTWETITLHTILPLPRWVFKRELLMVPFFGWALACTDPIAIDRSAGRKAVRQLVDKGTEKLERGKWVIVFPEGTRTAAGAETRYKMGGAVLAAESGYPVLPIAHNAGEFWPRHSFIKRPGCITVRVGELIESEGKDAEQILAETKQWIEAQVRDISTLKSA